MKNQLNKIVATFKANYNKPSYWIQIIGGVVVIGLLITHYAFGIDINSVEAMVIAIGMLLSLWGSITDNSILETAGDSLKGNSNQYIKIADTVSKTFDTAIDQLQSAKKEVVTTTQVAGSQADNVGSQSSAVASAYKDAASAAAVGDSMAVSAALSLADSATAVANTALAEANKSSKVVDSSAK